MLDVRSLDFGWTPNLGVPSGVCGAAGMRLSSERDSALTDESDPGSVQDLLRTCRDDDETSCLEDYSQVSSNSGICMTTNYLWVDLPT
jgi:hypothetical protein